MKHEVASGLHETLGAGADRPDTDRTTLRPGAGAAPREAAAAPPATLPEPLHPGMLLAGQYVLEDVVGGGGGLGTVFKARDLVQQEALDRNPYVAVKVLKEEFKQRPDAIAVLYGEYKNALQLSHPNIVKVQNFNRDGDDVFVVMELLEGRSLRDVIADLDAKGLPPGEALPIIHGLSRGLGYAHRLGLVHSHFKPGKAFLTKDGIVKILDFGLARAGTRRPARAPGASDDSRYASPEQIAGASPDPRDDVFALAVVSYELLTGQHPFDRQDAVTARLTGIKPRPVQGVSRRQWHTLQSALSFSRQERPANAGAFAEGLRPKQRPAKLLAAGAAAVLILVGLAWVLALNFIDRRRADRLITALSSAEPSVVAAAANELAEAGSASREAVLSHDGVKPAVLSVFKRRAREHFYPKAGLLDYPGAMASLDAARRLLSDYAPLQQFEQTLDGERKTAASDMTQVSAGALPPQDPTLSAARAIGVAPVRVRDEMETLRTARASADADNKSKSAAVRLAGDKQRVLDLAAAGGDRVDQAVTLYEHIRREIPAADTWGTVDGPRALADAHLQRAQTLADAGQFAAAANQARKIRHLPLDDPYYDARMVSFDRLAGLQQTLQSGDVDSAAQIAADLQRGDARSYAALEPLFARIMADRIKRLAATRPDEAARLATAARRLFPKQPFGLAAD